MAGLLVEVMNPVVNETYYSFQLTDYYELKATSNLHRLEHSRIAHHLIFVNRVIISQGTFKIKSPPSVSTVGGLLLRIQAFS